MSTGPDQPLRAIPMTNTERVPGLAVLISESGRSESVLPVVGGVVVGGAVVVGVVTGGAGVANGAMWRANGITRLAEPDRRTISTRAVDSGADESAVTVTAQSRADEHATPALTPDGRPSIDHRRFDGRFDDRRTAISADVPALSERARGDAVATGTRLAADAGEVGSTMVASGTSAMAMAAGTTTDQRVVLVGMRRFMILQTFL